MRREIIAAVTLLLAFFVLSYLIVMNNGIGLRENELRSLGKFYLENAFSHEGTYTSHSPEVVTAIIWNYRGFDTFFETFVFFLAIIGSLSALRMTEKQKDMLKVLSTFERIRKMDLIIRGITRVVVVMIVAISASIALHGHLTPGGGFQGGAALTVATLLFFATHSKYTAERKGLTLERSLGVYALGLLIIITTVLIPVYLGGRILEINLLGEVGLFNLDLGEYLAVGAGFLSIFLILGIPEKIFRELLRGEVE
ncbi:sodium:proton antiporter [Thermococcus sp. M39]|uniref:Na(+)/H(+) antiporter subunit B n=1 Tax=Thermococcus sp. M39 TaxID=1638262 RepID=UPI00143B1F23|nr:Na(+)/H(+) antiporter subunit B [Thermococcus sp. M39]NJE07655.1 sodium:proton antiporter [Thermococcus sp. M39]